MAGMSSISQYAGMLVQAVGVQIFAYFVQEAATQLTPPITRSLPTIQKSL